MKPEGKNWLFAILILGDIIQTFALELIAILCPSECVVSPLACAVSPTSANGTCVAAPANGTCTCVVTATVTIFSVIGIVSAIIPGILYVCKRIYDECQSNNDIKDKCQHYIDVTISCLYALLGPPLYYYGDNVSKVVDLVGDTFGCLDDCQRELRISGVAVLFLFLLGNIWIGRISKSKESKINSKWWGPVADMIVELLPLHILYSAFLSIARSNMIFTSTSFCSVGDQAVFAVVCTITFIYAIFSIFYISFMKFIEEKPPTGYKVIVGVSGIVVFLGFVVYLLFDNSLPLDFFLCLPDSDMAAVMQCLHFVRAGLSAFCAIVVLGLGAVPAVLYGCCKKQYPMTQTRLEAELRATLVEQWKKKLKTVSEEQLVYQTIEAARLAYSRVHSTLTELPNRLADTLKRKINEPENKLKVLDAVKQVAESVASQSNEQLKVLIEAVVDQLSFIVDQSNQEFNATDQLEVNPFTTQLVKQLVTQLVVAESVAESVARSVAESVAESVARSVAESVASQMELTKQLNNAQLMVELKVQLQTYSVAAHLVDELKPETVVNLAKDLEDALKVKCCC